MSSYFPNNQKFKIILFFFTMSFMQPSIAVAAEALGLMFLQAAISTGVSEFAHWGLSPSKSDAEYAARHALCQNMSKEDFIYQIKESQNTGMLTDANILIQHEMYRYPNFLAAIKDVCPNYASYIKALLHEVTSKRNSRFVRGFYVKRNGPIGLRNLRSLDERDEYEFFELIKKLAAQVEAEELQKSRSPPNQAPQEQANKDKQLKKLFEALSEEEKNDFIAACLSTIEQKQIDYRGS